MILKAEAKTCSALLHSQSVAQTHQIIEAAFKRAGLTSPFAPQRENQEETQSDPKRARFENDVIVALTNQVHITNQIAEQFQSTPRADEYVRLSDVFKTSQEASIKAVASLATVVRGCNNGKRHSYRMCWRGYPSQYLLAQTTHSRMRTLHSPMRTRVGDLQVTKMEMGTLQGIMIGGLVIMTLVLEKYHPKIGVRCREKTNQDKP